MNKKQKKNTINRTKKMTIVASLCCAMALLVFGVLALFTSRATSDFKSTAGTVIINVDNLFLTNSSNINPGDMDPNNPEDAAKGTSHTFSYTVSNTGTKSARTRHTIYLSADKAGESTDALDVSTLRLWIKDNMGKELCVDDFDLYPDTATNNLETKDVIIAGRFFVLSDDTEIASLEELSTLKEQNPELFVKAVKYTFLGNVYEGVGITGESEDADKLDTVSPRTELIKNENGICSDSYEFDFSMLRGTTNKLQGADIYITVVIEAMQYRNTTDNDWSLATTVSRTFSTSGISGGYVPDTDENKNGDKLSKTNGFTRTESADGTNAEDIETTEEITFTEIPFDTSRVWTETMESSIDDAIENQENE